MNKKILLLLAIVAVTAAVLAGGGGLYYTQVYQSFENQVKRWEPTDLTIALDDAHKVKATVGKEGGVIAAAGSDGNTYELNIPKNALVQETDITMTPIASGANAGYKLTSGVEFEPDDIEFMKPATLTIKGAGRYEHTVVTWHNGGKNASSFFGKKSGEDLTIPIIHFSGYGPLGEVGGIPVAPPVAGTPGDVSGPITNPSFDPEAAAIAELGRELRKGKLSQEERVKGFVRWYTILVEPKLKAATKNRKVLDVAMRRYFNWMAFTQLFGDDADPRIAEKQKAGMALMRQGVINAFKESSQACADNKDQKEGSYMFRMMSIAQVLIDVTEAELQDPQMWKRIQNCLRFEVKPTLDTSAKFGPIELTDKGSDPPFVVQLSQDGVIAGSGALTVHHKGYERLTVEIGEYLAQGFGALLGVDLPNDVNRTQYYTCGPNQDTQLQFTGTITGFKLSKKSGDYANAKMHLTIDNNPEVMVTCDGGLGTFPIPSFSGNEMYKVPLAKFMQEDGSLTSAELVPGKGATAHATMEGSYSEDTFTMNMKLDFELKHAPIATP